MFLGHCFFPAGHAVQLAPAVSESWPYMDVVSAGHAQAALPKVTSEPAEHEVQDAAPAREAKPLAQIEQNPVFPVAAKVPAAHCVQEPLPVAT